MFLLCETISDPCQRKCSRWGVRKTVSGNNCSVSVKWFSNIQWWLVRLQKASDGLFWMCKTGKWRDDAANAILHYLPEAPQSTWIVVMFGLGGAGNRKCRWNKNKTQSETRRLIHNGWGCCCQTVGTESQMAKQGSQCHRRLFQRESTWEVWDDARLPPWSVLSIISWSSEKETENQFCLHEIREQLTLTRSSTTHLVLFILISHVIVVWSRSQLCLCVFHVTG